MPCGVEASCGVPTTAPSPQPSPQRGEGARSAQSYALSKAKFSFHQTCSPATSPSNNSDRPSPLRGEGWGEGQRCSAECRAPTALALDRRRQAPSLPNCCVRQTCRPTTHSKQLGLPPRPSGERAGVRGCGVQPNAERRPRWRWAEDAKHRACRTVASARPADQPLTLKQLGLPPRPSGERAGVRGCGLQPNAERRPRWRWAEDAKHRACRTVASARTAAQPRPRQTTRTAPSPLWGEGWGEGLRSSAERRPFTRPPTIHA